MKLIDLLVQELPKRGGWPKEALYICLEGDGTPRIVGAGWHDNISLSGFKVDEAENMVDTDQYQEALTAAQQQVWNGEGLPPVGCEFEYGTHRTKAKCLAIGHHMVFASKGDPDDEEGDFEEFLIDALTEFHPLRSEADKKRDEIYLALAYYTNQADAAGIYDAIAAGKIPGVKLDA